MLTKNKKQMLNIRNVWTPHQRQKEGSAKCSNLAYRKEEAEAKQFKDWNPVYREQEADAKYQKWFGSSSKVRKKDQQNHSSTLLKEKRKQKPNRLN